MKYLLVVFVALLTACSAATPGTPVSSLSPIPPAAAPSTASASATPSASPSIQRNARGNIIKAPGQAAGLIDNTTGQPIWTLTLVSIKANFKCTDKYASASENGNFIAVLIDITTGPVPSEASLKVATPDMLTYKVIGSDGTTENDSQSGASYGCVSSKDSLPNTIGWGEHVKGYVLLDSQYSSGAIVIQHMLMEGGWEYSF